MQAEREVVPIIGGTGALGFGLAVRWALAGQAVAIGSRSAERAGEAAAKVSELAPDAQVAGLTNEEAVKLGSVVVLAVPFSAQAQNLATLQQPLAAGQLLVDCTVPLAGAVGGKATRSWAYGRARQPSRLKRSFRKE